MLHAASCLAMAASQSGWCTKGSLALAASQAGSNFACFRGRARRPLRCTSCTTPPLALVTASGLAPNTPGSKNCVLVVVVGGSLTPGPSFALGPVSAWPAHNQARGQHVVSGRRKTFVACEPFVAASTTARHMPCASSPCHCAAALAPVLPAPAPGGGVARAVPAGLGRRRRRGPAGLLA